MQRLKWTHVAVAGLMCLGGAATALLSGCGDKGDDSSMATGDAGALDGSSTQDASVSDATVDGAGKDAATSDASPSADSGGADVGTSDAKAGDGSVPDGSTDSGTIAQTDASTADATADTGAPDAGHDAATDSGADAGADAATDSGADAGADAATDSGADAGADAATDSGAEGGAPCAPGSTTQACLDSLGPGCLSCASDNGCFDTTQQGGTCETTHGAAALFSGALGDGKTCQQVVGSASPTETEVCLLALGEIFSSKCAATFQETPCLCGSTDAAMCLAGTATPTGPVYDLYQCDFDTTNVNTINSNFTIQTFGAGQANALVQCVAAFACNSCFGN
jgi:hypothetical protein